MGYQPIENYGIIGNMRTAALVGTDGSIDWWCFPRFDSPSIFAALLDDAKGGRFQIAPTMHGLRHKQFYWPDTNVLVTRFLSPDGVGQITDFMPVGISDEEPGHQWLVRRVNVVRGSMAFRLACCPAFNYARDPHQTVIFSGGVCFHAPGVNLELATRVPLKQDGNGVFAEFAMQEGEVAVFVLRQMQPGGGCNPLLSDNGDSHTLPSHRGLLAPLARQMFISRALARDGASRRPGAKAADLRAYRGDCRRPHL